MSATGAPARRWRRGLALVGVAVLALGACSADPSDEATTGWPAIRQTFTAGIDPESPNPCTRGADTCMSALLAEMEQRAGRLVDACDHDAVFALTYLRDTEALAEARDDGRFADRAWLNHIAAVFATLYFDAYDRWHAGDVEQVPAAWQVAFEAAEAGEATGVGDLIYAVNAHLSRDLPVVLASIDAELPPTPHDDYLMVGDVLLEIVPQVIDELAETLDPTIATIDVPVLDIDQDTVGALFVSWRADAWEDARRIVTASDPPAEVAAIGERALDRSRLARPFLDYPPLAGPDRRRSFCQGG